ncbi:hypothetical protein FI667_g6984, partial [Globisporangium splendens]
MEAVGLDEFGREHFVVEAAPERLCMSIAENDQGFIVVCGFDSLSSGDWDEVDLKRMRVLHQTVSIGDRLIAIEGEDVIHCSLCEVSARLGKLAAKKRLLTFARYHPSHYDRKKYDVEKLVLVRAPSGPLDLLISETVKYGAMIDGFQNLPDGSTGKLEQHSKIHRGCQLIHVNGVDVSSLPREEVITVLSNMRDQEKEIVLYRAAPNSRETFAKAEHATAEVPLGFCFNDNENFKCVVASTITPAIKASLLPGDILIGVNATDVSCLNRRDAIAVANAASFPRTLYFYRSRQRVLPECHQIRMESGPFGLNLDSAQPQHAVISGFTTPADAERSVFKHCASFLPGSLIISINKVNVAHHTLADISGFLLKLTHCQKDIVVCNTPLVEALKKQRSLEVICVPKGPLGIHFDGARQDYARISGFYVMSDGQPGAIEASHRIPIGAYLRSINNTNVPCLTLAQVTDLLKKLSDAPKELVFYLQHGAQDVNTKVINVYVPPGPLGIDLKSSISDKVIVDRLNQDQSIGATWIFDHGGVIPGSEIIAIDGFDLTSLELSEVTQLLRIMASHEKMITFSTTSDACTHMLSGSRRRTLKSVVVTRSPLGIEFDSHFPQKALISGYSTANTNAPPSELREEDIPIGSRLVALDHVDIRELSLHDIAKLLKDFAGVSKALVFEIVVGNPPPPAPRSPSKVAGLHIDVPGGEPSQGTTASPASSQLYQRSITQGSPKHSVTFADSPPSPTQQARASIIGRFDHSIAASTLAACSIVDQAAGGAEIDVANRSEQQQESPPKTEYLINMSSWTGSRSLYSMVVDLPNVALKITPAKPTSPRGAGKPGATNVVLFSDITAVEFGKKAGEGSSAPIVVTTKGKKSVDIDMRSRDERHEFHALLLSVRDEHTSGCCVSSLSFSAKMPREVTEFVGVFAGDDAFLGENTPEGFQDIPGQWYSTLQRKRGAVDSEATQRDSQATQKQTEAATELVTQPNDDDGDGSKPPVFVYAPDPFGDDDGYHHQQEPEEEIDEDETQIMMSMSQDREGLRTAHRKIEEEELVVPVSGNPANGTNNATSDDEGAESDMSDDMLAQDGPIDGLSSLAASLQQQGTEAERDAAKKKAPVYVSRSQFQNTPTPSVEGESSSSGAETEVEEEPESGLQRRRSAVTKAKEIAAHEADIAIQKLRRSRSTSEHSTSSEKGSHIENHNDGKKPKRIRLASSPISKATDDNDAKAIDASESTEQAHGRAKRVKHATAKAPKPSPVRNNKRTAAMVDDEGSKKQTESGRLSQLAACNSFEAEETQPSQLNGVNGKSRRQGQATTPPSQKRRLSHDSPGVSQKPEDTICVILTGLEPTPAIRKKIKAIANAVYEDDIEKATHVIVPKNQLKRTVKLLCGISRCQHILDVKWLDESARVGTALNEVDYCLKDTNAQQKWHFDLHKTMYEFTPEQRRQLFVGHTVFITNHKSVLPPVKDLVRIVECAGGKVEVKGSAGPSDLVITSEAALGVASVQKSLANANPQRVYSPELILSSILQQHIDFERNQLELPASNVSCTKYAPK